AHRKRLGAHRDGPVLEEAVSATPEGQPPEAAARQPTPSQVVIAEESWERLLRNQPPMLRRGPERLRQGHSYREIADEGGLHPKPLQRFLQKLTERSGLT